MQDFLGDIIHGIHVQAQLNYVEIPAESVQANEEHIWFSNPKNLSSGVVFRNAEGEGRRTFSDLSQLPLNTKFLSPCGNVVKRVSETEVSFGVHKLQLRLSDSKTDSLPSSFQQTLSMNSIVPETKNVKDFNTLSSFCSFLPGEKIIESIENSSLVDVTGTKKCLRGVICFTNYQLMFLSVSEDETKDQVLMPYGFFLRIEKFKTGQGLFRDVVIHQRTWQSPITFRFDIKAEMKIFIDSLEKYAWGVTDLRELFAFFYEPKWNFCPIDKSKYKRSWLTHLPDTYSNNDSRFPLFSEYNINSHTPDLFDYRSDFERMGIILQDFNSDNCSWTCSAINQNYELCPTYPSMLILPSKLKHEELQQSRRYRTKGRFPVVCWVHPVQKSSLSRSSQPKPGLLNAQSEGDVALLSAIFRANPNKGENNEKLYVFDLRPRPNAEVNRAIGAGYELEEHYDFVSLEFQSIANIHVMRNSYTMLRRVCDQFGGKEDSQWFSQIEKSEWPKHIQTILNVANRLTKLIDNGASVLVHCSDGWDRTAQVCSLCQLMLDPYYRTITGFCYLIHKEWILMGHQFSFRVGFHTRPNTERAPILEQFIDCVYQLLCQFPIAFEFNDKLLITLLDDLYSCKYGTFLGSCDKEREQLHIADLPSLWTFIHQKNNFLEYLNPLYSPPNKCTGESQFSVTAPVVLWKIDSFYMKNLTIWQNYYLRDGYFRDRRVDAYEIHIKHLQERIAALMMVLEEARGVQDVISSGEECQKRQEKDSILNQKQNLEIEPKINFWKNKKDDKPLTHSQPQRLSLQAGRSLMSRKRIQSQSQPRSQKSQHIPRFSQSHFQAQALDSKVHHQTKNQNQTSKTPQYHRPRSTNPFNVGWRYHKLLSPMTENKVTTPTSDPYLDNEHIIRSRSHNNLTHTHTRTKPGDSISASALNSQLEPTNSLKPISDSLTEMRPSLRSSLGSESISTTPQGPRLESLDPLQDLLDMLPDTQDPECSNSPVDPWLSLQPGSYLDNHFFPTPLKPEQELGLVPELKPEQEPKIELDKDEKSETESSEPLSDSNTLISIPIIIPIQTPVLTPIPTPISTPIPTPISTPIPTPISTPRLSQENLSELELDLVPSLSSRSRVGLELELGSEPVPESEWDQKQILAPVSVEQGLDLETGSLESQLELNLAAGIETDLKQETRTETIKLESEIELYPTARIGESDLKQEFEVLSPGVSVTQLLSNQVNPDENIAMSLPAPVQEPLLELEPNVKMTPEQVLEQIGEPQQPLSFQYPLQTQSHMTFQSQPFHGRPPLTSELRLRLQPRLRSIQYRIQQPVPPQFGPDDESHLTKSLLQSQQQSQPNFRSQNYRTISDLSTMTRSSSLTSELFLSNLRPLVSVLNWSEPLPVHQMLNPKVRLHECVKKSHKKLNSFLKDDYF